MALTASGTIYYLEGFSATDTNPTARNPVLSTIWTTATDNSITAALTLTNTDGAVVAVSNFSITTSEISGITITATGLQNQMREAVEKVIRDRLNALNGSTVITWS